jgi:hypothetical protein
MTRVLVTCAAQPPGRNAVRALIEHEEIELFPTDPNAEGLARLPFPVGKFHLPADPTPTNGIPHSLAIPMSLSNAALCMDVARLKQFCSDQRIEVILPGFDAMVLALSRHKDSFAKAGISMPVPDYDVAIRGIDKSNLLSCIKAAGLPYPRTVILRSERDLKKIAGLRFPVIAKPTIGHGARGVLVYDRPPQDWRDLQRRLRRTKLLVQEYVPGGPGSIFGCCFLLDDRHEIKLAFQQQSLRTEFEFGGAALTGVSVWNPKLHHYGERLIREIGPWKGIVMLEFKQHAESGEFFAMDCNARLWGLSSMAQDSGLSFPFGAVLVARNQRFRTRNSHLTGMHTERHGLVDRSTFVFSCGKTVSRLPLTAPTVRANTYVALIRRDPHQKWIRTNAQDPELQAVIVLRNGGNNDLTAHANDSKVYIWSPSDHLRAADLPYFAAHLFRAAGVRVINGDSNEMYTWEQLRHTWWFGTE